VAATPTDAVTIALVGMPGCASPRSGATGPRARLALLDTITEIEARIGGSIRTYFETHGEEAFRELEQEAVDEVTRCRRRHRHPAAGVVLRPANRRAAAHALPVFYIRSTPENCSAPAPRTPAPRLIAGAAPG